MTGTAPAAPAVISLVGWSGSGKTTLLTAVLPRLTAAGLSVSTVKHAHHGFDMDRPGKDSFRHREAGAREVLVMGGSRWALLHETRDAAEPRIEDLLARMAPVDLIIVEGFKSHSFPKIEVHRPALGKPPIWPQATGVVAVASDAALPDCPHPVLDLNDPAGVAEWLLRCVAASRLEPAAADGHIRERPSGTDRP
jgi:molybdopterin-guanine dinucleotide biosynthesis protein B